MMDASLWDETIAELSADHRCVAPTLPLGADLSLPGIARVVAEFLDRLNMHEVTLVGNDTGGACPAAYGRGRRPGGPVGARLLQRVRQLPARADRQDAGAVRQAVPGHVRAVRAAAAATAGPVAADRVRLADQAGR